MTGVSSSTALLVFLAFFITIVFITLLKKIYYFFGKKQRYYIFPKPSVQGIANIAMVVALSVAVLLILTFVTSNAFSVMFRAFPGSRVTIEGILIKIGGLLFGPFIGLFIGALTDLFSILMTAGIFHYGYFISAMAYGLISGLIKTIFTMWKRNKTWYAIMSSIVIAITCSLAIMFAAVVGGDTNNIKQTIVPFLPSDIDIKVVYYIFLGFAIISLIVVWLLYFFSSKYQKRKLNSGKRKHFKMNRSRKIDKDYFCNFCLILVSSIVTELLINVLLMPSFDADLSTLGYYNWFAIRVVIFIPMVIFNFVIIYPVYVIIYPIVQWDYKSELIEDSKIPLYIND